MYRIPLLLAHRVAKSVQNDVGEVRDVESEAGQEFFFQYAIELVPVFRRVCEAARVEGTCWNVEINDCSMGFVLATRSNTAVHMSTSSAFARTSFMRGAIYSIFGVFEII